MQFKDAANVLKNKILNGDFGVSGEKLPGIRELAEQLRCSYVTAFKAVDMLRDSHLVLAVGNCQYITTGRCAQNSPLEARLQPRRNRCFAIQIPTLDNHYFSKQAQIIYEQLLMRDQNVNVIISSSDPALEKKQLHELLSMDMSGLFYFPHRDFLNRRLYENYPLPVVAIGRLVKNYHRSVITVDNYNVGQIGARHLISKGYEEYAYIGYPHTDDMPDLRLNGFRDALREEGRVLQESNIHLLSRNETGRSMQGMVSFLRERDRVIGIFCYHDLLAVDLLKAVLFLRKSVPEQYGIIGCDDLPIAKSVTPPLTTIRYPFSRIGEIAIKTMYEELESGHSVNQSLGIKPELTERTSTALHTGINEMDYHD